MKELNVAILAAIEAGKSILEIYNSNTFEVQIKSDNSPLTRADILSHKVILSYLGDTNIPILSEEGKGVSFENRKNWNKLWIIDPIDGTKEFIKKNGEFTVNIALVENKKTVLGVIYSPALNQLYFSTKKDGSYRSKIDFNNYKIDELIKNADKLPFKRKDKTYIIVASRSHKSPKTEEYILNMKQKHGNVKILSKGSSLKFCLVADGSADCYPRFTPTMEWDTAAGQAICEHAGFNVIDSITEEKMEYNKENLLNNSFLVKK